MFEYDCPECGEEMQGSFGDNVYCKNCNITYETELEQVTYDSFSSWICGVLGEGKIDIDEEYI
tara:strand:+ start:35627 stop:35815 length:189 start_codon:yes stop_codon:yes gene_type:complete